MTPVLVIANDATIANSLATRHPNQVTTEAVSSPDEAKEKDSTLETSIWFSDAHGFEIRRRSPPHMEGNSKLLRLGIRSVSPLIWFRPD